MRDEKLLAIVGDEDIAAPFRALGFETLSSLAEAVKKNYAVCLVQDNIYKAEKIFISNYRNSYTPVFIPFSRDGSTALLDTLLKDIRLRATGTHGGDRFLSP
jgi:vacuolar-type H+-ATPase subunit F/Vma7